MPHIGSKCLRQDCRQVNEYMPTKCTFCRLSYCQDHFQPFQKLDLERGHLCPKYPADQRAIECPLCKQVLAGSRGKDPDEIVEQHIRKGCQNTSLQQTIYTNSCGFKGCSKREVIPITCKVCQMQFCIKHRSELDHKCQGPPKRGSKTKSKRSNSSSSKKDSCLMM